MALSRRQDTRRRLRSSIYDLIAGELEAGKQPCADDPTGEHAWMQGGSLAGAYQCRNGCYAMRVDYELSLHYRRGLA